MQVVLISDRNIDICESKFLPCIFTLGFAVYECFTQRNYILVLHQKQQQYFLIVHFIFRCDKLEDSVADSQSSRPTSAQCDHTRAVTETSQLTLPTS